MSRNPPPPPTNIIIYPPHPLEKVMDLRRLLKINSKKFIVCLRCPFIQLKLSLNDRELHNYKNAKARRCEGDCF